MTRPSFIRRLPLLAALAVAPGSLLVAAPAEASLGVACPAPAAQVFAPWNDSSTYAYAPDGGFEAGAAGWKLSGGAAVVLGSETFHVHGAGDAYSLRLPAGSSATSPPMCVGLLDGHMRAFVQNGGAATAKLRVQVIYDGGTGSLLGGLASTLGIADVSTFTAGPAWQPSPIVSMLGGTLPLLTQSVQFRFAPADSAGSWRIDDVYLDPLMHG